MDIVKLHGLSTRPIFRASQTYVDVLVGVHVVGENEIAVSRRGEEKEEKKEFHPGRIGGLSGEH